MSLGQNKFVVRPQAEVVKADEGIERTQVSANVPNLTLVVHFQEAKFGSLDQTCCIGQLDDTGGSAIHGTEFTSLGCAVAITERTLFTATHQPRQVEATAPEGMAASR